MDIFVEKGWELGGQADAAFKSSGKCADCSGVQYADFDVVTYQLTEVGAAIQATLQGARRKKRHPLIPPF